MKVKAFPIQRLLNKMALPTMAEADAGSPVSRLDRAHLLSAAGLVLRRRGVAKSLRVNACPVLAFPCCGRHTPGHKRDLTGCDTLCLREAFVKDAVCGGAGMRNSVTPWKGFE